MQSHKSRRFPTSSALTTVLAVSIVTAWLGNAARHAVAAAKTPAKTDQATEADAGKKPALTPAEAAFEKKMRNVALVGSFTMKGREKQPPRQERYVITKVQKLQGDQWVFYARVQYGGKDVPIAFPLDVKWAGDTPVISLTDMFIPGLGKYTARVLIYGDQYAGTWSGGKHGGQMFGRLEANKPDPKEGNGKAQAGKASSKTKPKGKE